MTEQLNISELRERIDAAITTVCSGMAAMSIPPNPRDVDLVLADCAKMLDERDQFAKTIADAAYDVGEYDHLQEAEELLQQCVAKYSYEQVSKVGKRLRQWRDKWALILDTQWQVSKERDALRAERDKANLRERNIFASLRMALGEDLGGGGGLVEILNGIEGLQDQRDAAESLAWDALGRPDGTHDMSNVQRLCEAHIALKAKLASKGACDIAAERSRQMEKWGNDHDDEHSGGALAYRAAELAAAHTHLRVFASPPDLWGLLEKHRETRQRLVIAGALVAAEIDRLDRAALAAAKVQP